MRSLVITLVILPFSGDSAILHAIDENGSVGHVYVVVDKTPTFDLLAAVMPTVRKSVSERMRFVEVNVFSSLAASAKMREYRGMGGSSPAFVQQSESDVYMHAARRVLTYYIDGVTPKARVLILPGCTIFEWMDATVKRRVSPSGCERRLFDSLILGGFESHEQSHTPSKYNATFFFTTLRSPTDADAHKILDRLLQYLPEMSINVGLRPDGVFATTLNFSPLTFGLYHKLLPVAEFVRNSGVQCVHVHGAPEYSCRHTGVTIP